MTDIVERLRQVVETRENEPIEQLCADAIAEITRLRTELEQLRAIAAEASTKFSRGSEQSPRQGANFSIGFPTPTLTSLPAWFISSIRQSNIPGRCVSFYCAIRIGFCTAATTRMDRTMRTRRQVLGWSARCGRSCSTAP